jgi:hypothetical protein
MRRVTVSLCKEQDWKDAVQKHATNFSDTLRNFAYFTATKLQVHLKFTLRMKAPFESFLITGCHSATLYTRVFEPSRLSSVFEISNRGFELHWGLVVCLYYSLIVLCRHMFLRWANPRI